RKSIYILIFIGVGFLVTVLILLSKLQKMAPKKVQDSSHSLVANETQESVSQVDYKASFAIYTNGTFRIFKSSMYHNLDGGVFITSESPNTIHVKKQGTT